ncbi:DUF7144 family membrane protein [Jiangella mangrovi]|uniref:Putative membrane protein n=1 Tax=Jiangella mangrovi TaxID=1524084 RepID=A0A7W9LM70_9ACTN|nr:hypothetical protein [Jiangella mangrovi]MBB5788936.1 putative membrane protein [Jiangella mangrovi]
MAQHGSIYERPSRRDSWAAAGLVFAATMMVLLGAFQALEGLAGLLDDDFYATVPDYSLDLDVTAWAWIHLIAGILLMIAGFALFSGSPVAGGVGIALAALAAIANFLFLPHYPVWSLVIIALCVFVIWAIVRSGVFVR